MKARFDRDADLSLLRNRKVAVVGYGSQGRAQSLNLRDSGVDVTVALHPQSKSVSRATSEGFVVVTVPEAVLSCDLIALLTPDTAAPEVYRQDIAPHLRSGQALLFAHGFNIRYGTISPPPGVDVVLVSPKGPGKQLRDLYVAGSGLAALLAVHQDASHQADAMALAYACAIGSGRVGVLDSSFAEETETDLFGEQVVLCGGVVELVKAAFETLVEAGYQPEVAYFECFHELKLVVDLMHHQGLRGMREIISDTAEWGGYVSGPRVVNESTRECMRRVLADIRDGSFARAWVDEDAKGRPEFRRLRELERGLGVEVVGARLRQLMTRAPMPRDAEEKTK